MGTSSLLLELHSHALNNCVLLTVYFKYMLHDSDVLPLALAATNGSTSESCNRLGSSSTTIRRNHQIRKVDCGLISVPTGNSIHLKGTSYNTVT